MARVDYYAILGVPRDESAGGIRAAYLDLAKRYHPDRVGREATQRLQEINEAYETLSDAPRRRAYNHLLDLQELRERSSDDVTLVRAHAPVPLEPEPVSVFRHADEIAPSFEQLRDRILRNFTGLGVPKSEHPEPLHLEVILSPQEARRGVLLPLNVPVFLRCRRCGGSGNQWGFPCLTCRCEGVVERYRTLQLRIPAGVRRGMRFEIPLHGLGIRNLYLHVDVDIDDT